MGHYKEEKLKEETAYLAALRKKIETEKAEVKAPAPRIHHYNPQPSIRARENQKYWNEMNCVTRGYF